MKKISSAIIVLVLSFSLAGCGFSFFKKTIPEGFKVFTIDLGGMTEEEAKAALLDGVESYVIKATVDSDEFEIPGINMGYKYNEDLDLSDMIDRINSAELTAEMIEQNLLTDPYDDYTVEGIMLEAYSNSLTLQLESKESLKLEIEDVSEKEIAVLKEKIDNIYDSTRAKIVLDEETNRFVTQDGVEGDTKDYANAVKTLKEAAGGLEPSVTLVAETVHSMGEKAADIPSLTQNAEEANKYFDLTITYNFTAPESETVSKVLDEENIGDYLYVSTNGRQVLIDETSLSLYAANICNETAKKTTVDSANEDNTVTTTVTGYSADSNTVYNNILKSMQDKTSDTYEAEYVEVTESYTSENGSKYIYVDLDNQKVTLYVDGEEAVTCSCVSGCVSQGRSTPTGTYSLYYKARNQTLRGPGYASFVSYWMPFNGGIGLHDADGWRSSYGGSIYLYSGSHGCINIPKWAAAKIYEQVDAGTRVVVVGGQQSTYRANDNATSSATTATTKAAQTISISDETTATKTTAETTAKETTKAASKSTEATTSKETSATSQQTQASTSQETSQSVSP